MLNTDHYNMLKTEQELREVLGQRLRDARRAKGFAPNDLRAKHATDLSRAGGNATANLQHDNPGITRRHYQAEDIIKPLSTIKGY